MKIILWILFLSFLICPGMLSNAQWVEQNSGVAADLNDVFFYDSLTGWVVGESSTILKTTDGGQNWRQIFIDNDTINIRQLEVLSENVLYDISREGHVILSINGGEEWVINKIGLQYVFNNISFINDSTGWIAGYWFTPEPPGKYETILLKT